MGSSIDSSRTEIRESITGRAPVLSESPLYLRGSRGLEGFSLDFAKCGGCFRKDIEELYPAVAGVHDEYLVFIDQEVPLPARNADEERLGVLLAIASAVGLARQIEREDASTVMRQPSLVAEGLVPTLGPVDEAAGTISELTFGTVLDKHVAGPEKINVCTYTE